MNIILDSVDKVKDFVREVSKFETDIDLVSSRFIVDAKSLMGIFTLDREQPLQLVAETTDSDALSSLTQAIGRFLQPVSKEA